MKNIHRITILALFALPLVLISCDKLLEEEPQNKLKPETFSDYDELLNYGYPAAPDYGSERPLDYYVEMMTDDVNLMFYNANLLPYPMIPYSFADTHEDNSMLGGYDQAWKNFYRAIYYANVVIDNVDEAVGTPQQIAYLKGEAMLLRAFSYFRLVNIYAKPYDVSTAGNDPGVPLTLDPAVQSESYVRNSVKEVYDQIDIDIREGLRLMKANDLSITSKSKLTPVAGELLASRVALYKKEYDKVITHATAVIQANPNFHNLSGFDFNVARGWGYGGQIHVFNNNNSNLLFRYGTNEFYHYVYYPGGMGVSDDLISQYEPGDIRLYYFTYPQGAGRRYYKFRPFPNRLAEPIRGFRTEEAYLNRAEAYAETDRPEDALADLNQLRRYKFDANYGETAGYYLLKLEDYPSKPEQINVVRKERRRELCFEFHRWYDLRRYGMPEIVHTHGSETFVLSEKDPRYVLQIPQRELDYNPLMGKNTRQ